MASDNFYSPLSFGQYKNNDGEIVGWQGVLHYYDAAMLDKNGRPTRRTTKKTTKTKSERRARAELTAWRDEMEAEARRMGFVSGKKKKKEPTVFEKVADYLKYQLSIGEIESSTYARQSEFCTWYIGGFDIGDFIFDKVDSRALMIWLSDLHNRGLSDNTIRTAWDILRKTYRYYYMSREIAANPCDYVHSPKKGDAKVTYLDDEQALYLLECRDKVYKPGSVMWTVLGIALYGGLRREEICGLRWQDVDFESGFLSIDSAVATAKDSDGKATSYTKEPKNRTSKRRFPLIPALRKTLQVRYDYVNEEQGTVQGNWFVVGKKTQHKPPATLSTQMGRFAREYEIKDHYGKYVTLHALRHNFATVGVNKTSMDIASLSQIMGHASKAMTLDTYSTATKDAVQIAMQKMGEAMNYEED